MFIVVYKEGDQGDIPLTYSSLGQAFILPGDKYIFEWNDVGSNYTTGRFDLYGDNGIWCHNNNGGKEIFEHGNYSLIKIIPYVPKNKQTWSYKFLFRNELGYKDIIKIENNMSDFPNALTLVVKEIILASKFDSWEQYQQNRDSKQENEKLKAEIVAITKERDELLKKIAELSKS